MSPEAGTQPKSVREWLDATVNHFRKAGLFFGHGSTNARDEAVYLLLHTLKLPLDELDPVLERRLTPAELETLEDIVRRRIDKRIPAAYLTREAWLGEFRFYVDERAIIPRSYIAEPLREQLQPWISEDQRVERATDLSADALEVAARNVAAYELRDRVHLRQTDLFAGLEGRYDVIVSNPPYVSRESMALLPREYRAEPQMALAGGADGLDIVRRLLAQARAHLTERGILIVEIGHNREALEQAYPKLPFTWLATSGGDGLVFLLMANDLPR
jgi:ribosomal protein L3 glutamine methyltransferase